MIARRRDPLIRLSAEEIVSPPRANSLGVKLKPGSEDWSKVHQPRLERPMRCDAQG